MVGVESNVSGGGYLGVSDVATAATQNIWKHGLMIMTHAQFRVANAIAHYHTILKAHQKIF